jgi:hypothetical protein
MAVVLATVAVTLLVQVAIAKISSPATTVVANGGLQQTKVVRSNDAFNDNTSAWVDVSDMTVNVNAPTKSLILVTFTAESDCYDATDSGSWCSLRAKIGSKVGEPNEGTSFAWQGGTSADPYEALSMTRSRIVSAGTYNVKLQMNANGLSFRLDDMSMVVQVIDV